MFDNFDAYISAFSMEDFADDYWYDEGVVIAENMLCAFDDTDWDKLLECIPKRTIEWQKRLAYCLHDENNLNNLRILLNLVESDDRELIEIVVHSLRSFTNEESIKLIQSNSQIVFKIAALIPEVGEVTKKVYGDFLKKHYR